MFLNESRGTDATGFFTNKGDWRKTNDRARKWFAATNINQWLDAACKNSWAVCGHTRGGTRGGNSAKNAHPFEYGPVIGSHNGVLDAPQKYVVDSEYAMDLLADNKPGEYQKALGDVVGWYVLTWFDKRDRGVYLLNWQGTLHLVEIDGTYYYSSEGEHLIAATGCTVEMVMSIAHGSVLRFGFDKATQKVSGVKLDDFTGKIRPKVEHVQSTYWRKQDPWAVENHVMKFPDGLWYARLNNGKFQLLNQTLQHHLNTTEWFCKKQPLDISYYGEFHSGRDFPLAPNVVKATHLTPIVDAPKEWKKPNWLLDAWDDEDTKVIGLIPQNDQAEKDKIRDDAARAVENAKRNRCSMRLRHLIQECGLSQQEALLEMDREGTYESQAELVGGWGL